MNREMPYVIAATALLLVISCSANAGHIVIGDSMTSSQCSWANVMNSHGYAHMQVHAMPGRALQDYTPSPDLKPWNDMKSVILWLGANDQFKYPGSDLFGATQTLIDELVGRGFEVTYILPPLGPGIDNLRHIENAKIIEAPKVETTDGVHPTCKGHYQLAFWMNVVIQKGEKE